jgi:hypothetical protein
MSAITETFSGPNHIKLSIGLVALSALGATGEWYHLRLPAGRKLVEAWYKTTDADPAGAGACVKLTARACHPDTATNVTASANRDLKVAIQNSAASSGGTAAAALHTAGGTGVESVVQNALIGQYATDFVYSQNLRIRLMDDNANDWTAGTATIDIHITPA